MVGEMDEMTAVNLAAYLVLKTVAQKAEMMAVYLAWMTVVLMAEMTVEYLV